MTGHDTKKRAEYFLENGTKVHISLASGKFYNGKILDIKEDFLIMKDDVLGDLPIWFSQIKEDGIDPYNEVGG